MSGSNSEPDYALNDSMGVVFIGLVIDSMLYGILTFQTHRFFGGESQDGSSLRILVAGLWMLDTFQLILLCHAVYHFLILNYGKPEVLEYSVWSLDLEVAPTVIVTFIVRCFFTARLWYLSDRSKILVSIIMVFSFAQLGIGLAVCVLTFTEDEFDRLPAYKVPLSLQQAAAVMADILISVPLVYFLNKSKTGIIKTNSLINRLILWSVSTAVITGVVELVQLTVWVGMTDTLLFLPFHLILAKLYTNCMLAMLNGRQKLREDFEGQMGNSSLVVGPGLQSDDAREITFSCQASLPVTNASKPTLSLSRVDTESIYQISQRWVCQIAESPVLQSTSSDLPLNTVDLDLQGEARNVGPYAY